MACQCYNVDVKAEGLHHYIDTTDAKGKPKKQYLGKSLETWRFALSCGCSQGHCYYETLNNFTARKHRDCRFCSIATESSGVRHAAGVPRSEKDLMLALLEQGLDKAVACQVGLPFWPGRIDLYHLPTKTAMQADGSSHFVQTYHAKPFEKLQLSLQCCIDAWNAQTRLLRVHYQHSQLAAVAVEATQLYHTRFIMVTKEYDSVPVTWDGVTKNYVEWLQCKLPGAKWYLHPAVACTVFH